MEEEKKKSGWKKWLVFAILAVAIVVAGWFASKLRHFSGYESLGFTGLKSAGSFHYTEMDGNLVRFGQDGAVCTDGSGKTVWNVSFEMQNPKMSLSGSELMIYDQSGTSIVIIDGNGDVTPITTSYPITASSVASNGASACVMQDGTTAHLMLYNKKGKLSAAGEIHMNNGGYPTALAISPDASKICVSLISLQDGTLGSTVQFYNFGDAGKKKIDNLVAEYKYKDTIFPEAGFSDQGRAVVIGTDRIVFYSGGGTPKETKTLRPSGKMKIVMKNGGRVGYIAEKKQDDGTLANTAFVYDYNGIRRFEKTVGDDILDAEFLSNNELMTSDGRRLEILGIFGTVRYRHTFSEGIRQILSEDGGNRYYLIEEDGIREIRLH